MRQYIEINVLTTKTNTFFKHFFSTKEMIKIDISLNNNISQNIDFS